MDNNVVIAGWERGIRGLNGNGKNTIKIKLKKKNENISPHKDLYRNVYNHQKLEASTGKWITNK